MNWEDKEIDGLFKGAKAPEAPAFQESFWKEMEALLPEQKRSKKAAFWWLSGAAGMVLLLTGLWFLLPAGTEASRTAANNNVTAETPAAASEPAASAGEPSPAAENTESNASATPAMSGQAGQEAAKARFFSAETPVPTAQTAAGTGNYQLNPAETIVTAPAAVAVTPSELQERTPARVENLPLLPLTASTSGSLLPPSRYMYVRKPERFYLQAAAGIGQSAQRNVSGHSDFLHYYSIGGGLYEQVGRIYLSFGLQGRMDIAQNIFHAGKTTAQLLHTETRYSQLYSFDMPLSIGYRAGKNSFGLTFTPGFQAGFTGRYTEYDQYNAVVRSGKQSGQTEQSKTLTMEVGVSYLRNVCPNWYLGCTISMDAISPYGDGSFYGDNRLLPVNGGVLLRRTF